MGAPAARRGGGASRLLRVALTVAGLAVSIYLTAVHYDASVPLACGHAGIVDCAQVVTSPESVWFGLPVAAWGLLWFAVMLILVLLRPGPGNWRATTAWTIAGGVVVVYLVYLELLVIGSICLWCTAVHVLVLTLLALQVLSAPPVA